MSIEDRVRQLLADAVADEPPLRGAPLDAALRRRRRRPLLAGAVALTVVLAAVVALAAVQTRQRPLPSTISTNGWKTYTNTDGNLRFRYPPDWRLQLKEGFGGRGSRFVTLVPPGIAIPPKEQPSFSVSVDAGPLFWIGEDWFGTTSLGRLPGGQSYLRTASDPTNTTTGWQRPPPAVIDRPRHATWSIDWGRPCLGGDARCVPHSVRVNLQAADGRLWDRYRAVAETIPTTLEQLRPTKPSVGDRGLPACRPDQWRLIWPESTAAPTAPRRPPSRAVSSTARGRAVISASPFAWRWRIVAGGCCRSGAIRPASPWKATCRWTACSATAGPGSSAGR